MEWPKRLAQLDNQLYIRRETYRVLREWNVVYVSVGHSIILPWTHTCKLIERPHFLGINGIEVKIMLGHMWVMLGTYVNVELANPVTKFTLLVIE